MDLRNESREVLRLSVMPIHPPAVPDPSPPALTDLQPPAAVPDDLLQIPDNPLLPRSATSAGGSLDLVPTPYIENTFYLFCDASYKAVRLQPGWKIRSIQLKGPNWQWVVCPKSGANTASFSIRIRACKTVDTPAQGSVVTLEGPPAPPTGKPPSPPSSAPPPSPPTVDDKTGARIPSPPRSSHASRPFPR